MSYTEEQWKTFRVGGVAITKGMRVKLSSGLLVVAVLADDDEVGTARQNAEPGELCAVRLRNSSGTIEYIAGDTLSVGDPVFTHAAGRVGDSATGAFRRGFALTAGADGEIIEVLPAEDPVAVPA